MLTFKKLPFLALLSIFLALPISAKAQCIGYTTQAVPFAFETLTITNGAAVSFTAATYATTTQTATFAVVTVETQPARYRVDGTAPTTSVGHLVGSSVPDQLIVCGVTSVKNFKAIATTGSNSTFTVTYYTGGS